jgi:hypothetical protein
MKIFLFLKKVVKKRKVIKKYMEKVLIKWKKDFRDLDKTILKLKDRKIF